MRIEGGMDGTLDVARAGWDEETRLVDRAARGDHRAFEALLDRRLETTFRTALAILGNEADARDATQEIFVRAWRRLPSLHRPELFPAWFGRIVVNTSRSHVRDRRRRAVREIAVDVEVDGTGGLPMQPSVEDSIVDVEERRSEATRIARAFEALDADDRVLLALHHYRHLPLDEIATATGRSVPAVKSRLFRARRTLQGLLQGGAS